VLSGFRDGSVRVHSADRLTEFQVTGKQFTERVTAAAINDCETWGVTGTETVDIWLTRLMTAESTQIVRGHHDRVSALAFSGEKLLASGGLDAQLRLWRVDKDRLIELLTLRLPRPIRSLAFHPDGVRLGILCDSDRAIRIWDLSRFLDRLRVLGHGEEFESCLQKKPLPTPRPAIHPPVLDPFPPVQGLRGDYFADPDHRLFVRSRVDAAIDFSWGEMSPAAGVPPNNFSVRWTGWLKAPQPGKYRLRISADDSARLWLNGRLILHDISFRPEVEFTDALQSLRLDMGEFTGQSHIRLYWQGPGMSDEQIIAPNNFFTAVDPANRTSVPTPPKTTR
jgi:WD40 repeat protein